MAERHVPDGYMYKTTMQAVAEAGQFEEAFIIMNRMYEITKREDIHQFGESQLAYVAGNMVGTKQLSDSLHSTHASRLSSHET